LVYFIEAFMAYEKDSFEQLTQDNEELREALANLTEQKQQLEAQLHNREAEIHALMGVPPHPVIARFDRDFRHIYVNSAVKLATGIPPEQYIGKTSREMGTPEIILPLFEGTIQDVFKKGTEKTIEYSVMAADSKWTFQSRMVPEFEAGSKSVSTVLIVTRNITQQKRAEQALLENYEILETVHSVGQALSGELDSEKVVNTVTESATHVTGAEYGVFLANQMDERGKYVIAALSGPPREIFEHFPIARTNDVFDTTLRDGQKIRLADVRQDPRYAHKLPIYALPDGYHPTHSLLAVPVISQSRAVLGAIFLGHPEVGMFTERHERIIEGLAAQTAVAIDNARLYNEARSQQEHLRITLASIGDAVIATDAHGNINFMNPVAQSLTAWSDQEAVGRPLEHIFQIVNEATRETVESPVAKVMRQGSIVGLANHTILLTRDGREIPIDDSGAPIYDEDNHLIGVILVFRDITERKQNEQRINLLLELTGAFSQALTSSQIAEVVVERALKALGGLLGTVALLVENGTMLEMLNLRGLSAATVEKYRRTPLDLAGPLNDAVRTGSIIWLETYEQYAARYPHFADNIKSNGSQSTVCIPLKVNEKIIGGFNLSFGFEKPHSLGEEAFFVALAQQCAQSLERARLYEAEKGRGEQ
jgi:PAS domain S-box-containing protein